jgi:hypothetical protein
VLLIEDGSLRGSNLGMLTIQYLFLTGIDQNFIVDRIGFFLKNGTPLVRKTSYLHFVIYTFFLTYMCF